MAEYRLKIHPGFYKNYGPDRYGRPTMSGVSDEQQAQWDARRASLAELAQQIREGRGGQGDVDHMVGERMNPLTTAAMFVGGAPSAVGGASGLLATVGFTLGTMEGTNWLVENDHPDVARYANLGMLAASVPGIVRTSTGKTAAFINDAVAEPTPQKTNLLKAMYDAWLKQSEKDILRENLSPAPSPAFHDGPRRQARVRTIPYIEDVQEPHLSNSGTSMTSMSAPGVSAAKGSGSQNSPWHDLPLDKQNDLLLDYLAGKVQEIHGVPNEPLQKFKKIIDSSGGIDEFMHEANDHGIFDPAEYFDLYVYPKPKSAKAGKPVASETTPDVTPEPFDPQELLTPPRIKSTWSRPDQAAQDRWYSKLVERFGEDTADYIRGTFNSEFFDRYFYGDNPEATLGLYKKYETLRGIYDKIAEPNKILLGGSSSIGSEGTILRNEIGHDLDFQANIANASGRTDIGTPEATAAMVAALKNRANVENAPIIQKLRRLYPQLADAKFRYAERKFQWWGDDKYQPDVFTVPIPEPSTTPTGEVNLMVNVLLDGQKVDLMLTDSAMLPSKANPRLGQAQTALHWKAAYLQEALAKGRPLTKGQLKHQADLARYREYSKDNMLVDPRSRRAQYAPFDFPENRLIDEDGMPVVGEMETFPGSGERIPVFMNAQGRILPAEDPNMLTTWYDPRHPQNNPRYANPPATKDTHPLVAIRGAERFLRAPRGENTGVEDPLPGRGFQHGEPAPGIGIYPANNPELLVDEIIKGGRWSTYRNGKHKDMIFYPREAVDPMADSGNVLHAEDAYWSNPWGFNTDGIADRAAALGTPEAIDALGRYFGRTAHIPEGQFTEIGNAYRNYLYERNPEGHYNRPPNAGVYDGYGEARHLGRVPDGVVVPGELIDSDPGKAKAMMLELVKKGMFLLPAAAGALESGDEETQQAAKAGNSPDRFSTARNFLATDEVPETIFGIPVVAREEDYTPEDIAFFRKHPEAGGYYDLGDGETSAPSLPATTNMSASGGSTQTSEEP